MAASAQISKQTGDLRQETVGSRQQAGDRQDTWLVEDTSWWLRAGLRWQLAAAAYRCRPAVSTSLQQQGGSLQPILQHIATHRHTSICNKRQS